MRWIGFEHHERWLHMVAATDLRSVFATCALMLGRSAEIKYQDQGRELCIACEFGFPKRGEKRWV
jgi:hypothetical protein